MASITRNTQNLKPSPDKPPLFSQFFLSIDMFVMEKRTVHLATMRKAVQQNNLKQLPQQRPQQNQHLVQVLCAKQVTSVWHEKWYVINTKIVCQAVKTKHVVLRISIFVLRNQVHHLENVSRNGWYVMGLKIAMMTVMSATVLILPRHRYEFSSILAYFVNIF